MKLFDSSDIPEDFYPSNTFDLKEIVGNICVDVKKNGDQALRKYSDQFDNIGNLPFELTDVEILNAFELVDQTVMDALKFAIDNIRNFAELQMENFKDVYIETPYGKFGHNVIPIDRVLCYVPGGRYPLPSSALMTIIPAKVAGVEDIIATSPNIHPLTIVACKLAGATQIYRIGGIQAIAGFAYGTESIKNVSKIVGPGNQYVTQAKKYVYGTVGIDFLAGPSEVLVIADEIANPKWIAADLLAQAEHDPRSQADLITNSKTVAKQVITELKNQQESLSTNCITRKSIQNSKIILVKELEEAIQISNKKSPEHLILHTEKLNHLKTKFRNYGSLFIGNNSAEVFGDYCSGPNHTLPTNGGARYTGGLSVKDFIKLQTFQEISSNNIRKLSTMTSVLANEEGLAGHSHAAKIRNN